MIENRKPAVTFKGDGNTTVFPFSFALVEANDLYVSIYDTATGTVTQLTRDYYVDMAGKAVHYPGYAPGQEPAGHDRPPALPAGKTITLYRRTDIDQRTDLGEKYPLPYIEKMSDKATAIMQELEEQIGRSVKVALGDPKTPEQRLTDLQTYVLNAKNAASVADQSARSAGDSKNAAASSATNSARSAAASEASRQASAESESKIKNMQVDVHAMQNHVDEVKTAIDGVAARAKADGQTASDAAVQAQHSAGASAQSAAASEASAVRAETATKYEGIVKSENLAEKSVHKKHLHADAYESPALTGTPTAPTASAGTRSDQIATTNFVAAAITALVNFSPAALDTLQELAKAIGNDPNFATTILNKIAEKVSKSGDIMSGDLNLGKSLHFTGGVTSAGIWPGQKDVGDPISAQDANLVIGSWYGIAFYDQCNNRVMCGLDVRSGTFRTLGQIEAKAGFVGQLIGKADNAGHSDTSKSADDANKLGGKSLSDILDKINAQNTGGVVASSIAQNGWVKFANGLIVQWGTIDGLSSVNKAYAFPIEFLNKAFMVMGFSISYEYGVDFRALSKAQFIASWWPDEFGSTPQNGHPVQFIAIGH